MTSVSECEGGTGGLAAISGMEPGSWAWAARARGESRRDAARKSFMKARV